MISTVVRVPLPARIAALTLVMMLSACTSEPEVSSAESSLVPQTEDTLSSGAPETSPTTAAPTTIAPTTAAPTTEPPTTVSSIPVIDFDGPSVATSPEAFLSDRQFLNGLLSDGDPEIELLDIPFGGFTTVPLEDGRAATGAFATESGFIGFVVDEPTLAVLAVVLFVDTDGETAAELFLTTFGVAGEPGPSFSELSEAYAAVVSAGVVDVPSYVVSGTNDFVISLTDGAQPDDELVSVVIAPTTDEATAIANAADLAIDALASVL